MTDKKTTDGSLAAETPAVETATPDMSPMDACILHAREIKDTQLDKIKSKNYDFAPEFRDLTLQLYLFGVMWKFAENLSNVEDPRELAFTALQTMMMQDKLQKQKAIKRTEFLKKMSKLEDDHDALAVAIGYESEPDDNSLAEVFDHYVDDLQVSGAFWRLYDRGKKIMLYGGLGIAFVVIWFITLFMPGNSAIAILAAGLISAAIFVIPVFLIGVFIYHTKLKKAKQAS